jgi:hypothetical protein
MTLIIPERLELLPTLHLDRSSHQSFEDGHCIQEVSAWLAGEPHSDRPKCVSPVLCNYTASLNDQWDNGQRQKLLPYAATIIGTAGDGQDEARSYLALDWVIRSFTPAWLDLAGLAAEAKSLRNLRRVVDLAASEAAAPVLRDAQKKAAAAWDAARAAARAAAGAAAWEAAWAAARAAARDAAGAATRDAAWDAARDALQPTVVILQESALGLLDRMINPAEVAA